MLEMKGSENVCPKCGAEGSVKLENLGKVNIFSKLVHEILKYIATCIKCGAVGYGYYQYKSTIKVLPEPEKITYSFSEGEDNISEDWLIFIKKRAKN